MRGCRTVSQIAPRATPTQCPRSGNSPAPSSRRSSRSPATRRRTRSAARPGRDDRRRQVDLARTARSRWARTACTSPTRARSSAPSSTGRSSSTTRARRRRRRDVKVGETAFEVARVPLVFCASSCKGADKSALQGAAATLGAPVIGEWRADVTHLVMPTIAFAPAAARAGGGGAVVLPAWAAAAAARTTAGQRCPASPSSRRLRARRRARRRRRRSTPTSCASNPSAKRSSLVSASSRRRAPRGDDEKILVRWAPR